MIHIIFAFMAGVLVGLAYMHKRYTNMMRSHLAELKEIQLAQAKNEGMLEALRIVRGVEEETE